MARDVVGRLSAGRDSDISFCFPSCGCTVTARALFGKDLRKVQRISTIALLQDRVGIRSG